MGTKIPGKASVTWHKSCTASCKTMNHFSVVSGVKQIELLILCLRR